MKLALCSERQGGGKACERIFYGVLVSMSRLMALSR